MSDFIFWQLNNLEAPFWLPAIGVILFFVVLVGIDKALKSNSSISNRPVSVCIAASLIWVTMVAFWHIVFLTVFVMFGVELANKLYHEWRPKE